METQPKKDYIDHETIHCIFVKTIRVIHFADFVQYVRDSADMLMQHFHMLIKTDSEMHHIVCRLLAYKLIFLRLHWGAGTRKNSYLPIQMFFFKLILLLFSILFALILRQTVYWSRILSKIICTEKGEVKFLLSDPENGQKPITSKYPITKVFYLLFFCSCCCFLVISRHNMIPLQWGSSLFC